MTFDWLWKKIFWWLHTWRLGGSQKWHLGGFTIDVWVASQMMFGWLDRWQLVGFQPLAFDGFTNYIWSALEIMPGWLPNIRLGLPSDVTFVWPAEVTLGCLSNITFEILHWDCFQDTEPGWLSKQQVWVISKIKSLDGTYLVCLVGLGNHIWIACYNKSGFKSHLGSFHKSRLGCFRKSHLVDFGSWQAKCSVLERTWENTFTVPSRVRKIFKALMSLWMMLRSWRYAATRTQGMRKLKTWEYTK